ncbi:MAG: Uma2 family endonuclease [Lachnospiraceae bacterium]|nr:Uma2 family endonuclease [Lachnospiraceae bacterium]
MYTIEEMKRAKAEHGFSYEEIAKRTGLPYRTVQKIFSGETAKPRDITMMKLQRLFNDQCLVRDPFEKVYFNDDLEPHVTVLRDEPAEYRSSFGHGPNSLADLKKLPVGTRAELDDGFLIYLESPSVRHQIAVEEIGFQIRSYIKSHHGRCLMLYAPMDVRLKNAWNETDVFQPDLLIVCDPDKVKENYIEGAPDFCLEVVSKASRNRDLRKKMMKYLDGGVREYWALDLEREKLIVYREDEIPVIYGLNGSVPVGIYGDDLKIDLTQIPAG